MIYVYKNDRNIRSYRWTQQFQYRRSYYTYLSVVIKVWPPKNRYVLRKEKCSLNAPRNCRVVPNADIQRIKNEITKFYHTLSYLRFKLFVQQTTAWQIDFLPAEASQKSQITTVFAIIWRAPMNSYHNWSNSFKRDL